MNRDQKIKLLIGIAAGTIQPSALQPQRLTIRVGYSPEGTLWMINGKAVTKEAFMNQSATRQLSGPAKKGFAINYKKENHAA